ncbi:hypothetical protein DFH09DRAFT_1128201 [Mycena vulgaris]|nr:hypothetical protein DFH09DRAFT_1128201 [Mycena vulgaris]
MADFDTATYTHFQSPMVVVVAATLPFIPTGILHYIVLAVASLLLVLYGIHYNRPSIRLCRLNDYVKATGEILARAKLECVRNHFELTVEEGRLLQIQLAISKTQSRMLETRKAPWKLYLQTLTVVLRTLANCEHAVRQAQTATLLIIEADHQRKLCEDIAESREIVNGMVHPAGHGLWCPQSVHGYEKLSQGSPI